MGFNDESVAKASACMLTDGPLIFERAPRLISALFGDTLLSWIEHALHTAVGLATVKFCEDTGLYYAPRRFAHNLVLDRNIILYVQEWTEMCVVNYNVITDRADPLSHIVYKWVARNAVLPEDLMASGALRNMYPDEWVEQLRTIDEQVKQVKRGGEIGDYADAVLLSRTLPNGQLCLLHWYADMIRQQNRRLKAKFSGGLLEAAERLGESIL